jgi:ribosome production factor 1
MPPSKRIKLSEKSALPFKTGNKLKRQELHIKQKQARDSSRRAERFGRKKEEAKNPKLREERLRNNIPLTIDRKRVWDDVHEDADDGGLGLSVDVERLKRQRLEEEQALPEDETLEHHEEGNDSDNDSMLDASSSSDSEPELDSDGEAIKPPKNPLPSKSQLRSATARATSPTRSTASAATNLSLAPEALALKFPTLFAAAGSSSSTSTSSTEPPPTPKILITTSINSSLHTEARTLCTLFPNSHYVPRSSHRYGHKFSVREISAFAAARKYTSVLVLSEAMHEKRPDGLTVVHLPAGPTFHFSIQNFLPPSVLPGHGNPTSHPPELILNNFRTPLGLLTATLFRTLYPPIPDLRGRQVVTLHNQRDFIFLRRHRYVFRDRRETEKKVVGADGKEMKGVEEVRAGLQELGPRMTLKLRRIDKGIQRSSGQEWEWKGKTDRVRTKFQL